MAELLLEILSEEMPARMVLDGVEKLDVLLQKELAEIASVSVGKVERYSSPRRIALLYSDVVENLSGEEVRGPKVDAPEAAISGFLRKYGLSGVDQLEVRSGMYIYHMLRKEGGLPDLASQAVQRALEKLVWPKSMRWGSYDIKWVRPIHSIICIFDGKVLPVKFGHITAGAVTKGHRYLADENVVINNVDAYASKLRKMHVEVDYDRRKQLILDQINGIIPTGLRLKWDEKLLEEVTNLVEFPFVMLGDISSNLMKLPPEVLIITLKENQKYLLLEDVNGDLAPYFIIVSNIPGKNKGEEIVAGNQRVLQARLYDAIFFYEQDKKETLASRVLQLKSLAYHAEIGSVYDKMQGVVDMACSLTPLFNIAPELATQAATLAKADLVTNMVKEFPELQGVMGYYYALNEGLGQELAMAIKEHYKPQGPSDAVPSTPLGRLIALADKLDSIKQLFAIGIKPTSSKDPFALRRAAIGSLRILQEQEVDAMELHKLGLGSEVVEFVLERLKFM